MQIPCSGYYCLKKITPKKMSILFMLFLLVGVSRTFSVRSLGNEIFSEPIASSFENSLCADLCFMGLNGNQCFENCLVSEGDDSIKVKNLCYKVCGFQNSVLKCNCNYNPSGEVPGAVVNKAIASNECDSCERYERKKREAEDSTTEEEKVETTTEFDQVKWCKQQCAEGNGGAACNCDILPLAAALT